MNDLKSLAIAIAAILIAEAIEHAGTRLTRKFHERGERNGKHAKRD